MYEKFHKFREFRYTKNSLDELLEDLEQPEADESACQKWDITPDEWRQATVAAAAERVQDIIRAWSHEKVSQLFAQWRPGECELDQQSATFTVFDSKNQKWLDEDEMIEFYRWYSKRPRRH